MSKKLPSFHQVILLLVLTIYSAPAVSSAEDWPTYQHDNARSGQTSESLSPVLKESWVFKSVHPPHLAWPGPAKWDGWNKVYNLKDRMVFDKAFQVAASGDHVYFGSSIDDSVKCLDTKTGQLKWQFITEGPVRLAPGIVKDRLYFGSDDGYVYCLNSEDGSLVWKHRPGKTDLRVSGNGRVVSLWAIRTGVVVVDDIAYACAGVFPAETVFLVAMDAKTGKELWKTGMKDFPAQGYILASYSNIYVTTGRSQPLVFERETGKRLYQVSGGSTGGTYALLTGDQIMFGPGKTGRMALFGKEQKDHLATFEGNHMIIRENMSYLHTDTELSALDRDRYIKIYGQRMKLLIEQKELSRKISKENPPKEEAQKLRERISELGKEIDLLTTELGQCILWKAPCNQPNSLILGGDKLYAGGDGDFAVYSVNKGEKLWEQKVEGKVFGLAIANGNLYVSTDEGFIYSFSADGSTEAELENKLTRIKTDSSAVESESDIKPLYEWIFDQVRIKPEKVDPVHGQYSLVIGGKPARIGKPPQALLLDGKETSLLATTKLYSLKLPKEQATYEAWALIDKPEVKGALISAFQHNGDYQKGFILGFTEGNHFSLGLKTEGTDDMTFVSDPSEFETGRWYHVAGTYDGNTMNLYVNGKQVGSSDAPSGKIERAPKGFFEIGAYHDDDENIKTRGMIHRAGIFEKALSEKEIVSRFEAEEKILPRNTEFEFGPFENVVGPFTEYTSNSQVRLNWQTSKPMKSVLYWSENGRKAEKYELGPAGTSHEIVMEAIKPETIYHYRIVASDDEGHQLITREYEFDSTFKYLPLKLPEGSSPFEENDYGTEISKFADRILLELDRKKGYALVIGGGEGRLAIELAQKSDLKIIVIESNENKVNSIREKMMAAGIHGYRVSIHHIPENEPLPYGPFLANLITSESCLSDGKLPRKLEELYPCLTPSSGVMHFGRFPKDNQESENWNELTEWVGASNLEQGKSSTINNSDGSFWVHRRGKLPGAGEWTHQYGLPNNSSCSQDDLVRGDLSVLWWGRPGPRPMPDRGPRNPAPVSSNGRLFVQGNRTLFGLDSYNGTILWAKQIPTMRRANIPRDSSNMVAADDYLYLLIDGFCIEIDGDTGNFRRILTPQEQSENEQFDWGYLSVIDSEMIGTRVKKNSIYIGDDGEWYEDFKTQELARVTSSSLFVLNRSDGQQKWNYSKGVILNSTITSEDGKLYFVESRNKAAIESETGQLFESVQKDQFLVALDLASGNVIWEQPFDFSQCQYMTYMVLRGNRLVVLGSDKNRIFHLYAFDSESGEPVWDDHAVAEKKHHSGQLAHPTIVGTKFYVNKKVYDLASGKVLETDEFDWHGCGVTSSSNHSIFRRYEYHGMQDLHTGERTEFLGIRTGCWLSMIPSGGLLLAPETSAGCSCSHAIQTSIAYVPNHFHELLMKKAEMQFPTEKNLE